MDQPSENNSHNSYGSVASRLLTRDQLRHTYGQAATCRTAAAGYHPFAKPSASSSPLFITQPSRHQLRHTYGPAATCRTAAAGYHPFTEPSASSPPLFISQPYCHQGLSRGQHYFFFNFQHYNIRDCYDTIAYICKAIGYHQRNSQRSAEPFITENETTSIISETNTYQRAWKYCIADLGSAAVSVRPKAYISCL
jgi:hypothetical protein